MLAPSVCASRDVLTQLLTDSLPSHEQQRVQAHLEGCSACRQTLEGLAGGLDSWSDAARNLGAQADPDDPILAKALGELEGKGETIAQTLPAADDDLSFLQPSDKPGYLGRLDHYAILELIGKGGMGIVFKAFDESLHRVVALKVMAPQLAVSANARNRFLREAKAAAAVRDEHVIDIHAIGPGQVPYLVMEFIRGMSLQEMVDRQGPLELKEILRIGQQTARGLAAAHAQGLVHRDIKPGNILLENGVQRVKITDFGLARAVDDASLTQSGLVAGTPMYMAPEQAAGESIDHRADLFSLGSVLYTMCTGRPPFRASGMHAVLKRVVDDTPRPIQEINPEIPAWLCDIVAKLHAKKPEERHQTAQEVADLLGQHLAHVQHPSKVALPAAGALKSGNTPARAGAELPARGREAAPGAIGFVMGLALYALYLGPLFVAYYFLFEAATRTWGLSTRMTLLAGAGVTAGLALLVWLISTRLSARGARRGLTGVAVILAIVALGLAVAWVRQIGRPATLLVEAEDQQVRVSLRSPDGAYSQVFAPGAEVNVPSGTYEVKVLCGEGNRIDSVSVHEGKRTFPRGAAEDEFLLQLDAAQKVTLSVVVSALAKGPATPQLAVAPFDAKKAKEHQEAWAKHLGVPVEIENSIGMKLRLIPPGEFLSGSTAAEVEEVVKNTKGFEWAHHHIRAEAPPKKERLEAAYYLDVHEVTVEQFARFVKETGHRTTVEENGKGGQAWKDSVLETRPEYTWNHKDFAPTPHHAVVHLTRADAQAFCRWLSEKEGRRYGLPTVPMWEFACSAGATTRWFFGNDPAAAADHLWTRATSWSVQPVGKKLANPFGLYDMCGNVDEMAVSRDGQFYLCGGATFLTAWLCRSASRLPSPDPDHAYFQNGFRVAITGDLNAKTPPAEPFVIVAKDAKAERKLATLAEAVAAAQAGDIIEIRGDGPFVCEPIVIKDKALVIRAGAGFRPVLQQSAAAVADSRSLILTNAPLVLEGLDLRRVMTGKRKPGTPATAVVWSEKAPLYFACCRFLNQGESNTILVYQPCELRNCLFVTPGAYSCVTGVPEGGPWTVEGCLAVGDGSCLSVHTRPKAETRYDFRLRRNTFMRVTPAYIRLWPRDRELLDTAAGTPPLRWELSDNIVGLWWHGALELHQGDEFLKTGPALTVEQIDRLAPKLIAWQEQGNCYQADQAFFKVTEYTKRVTLSGAFTNLADWERLWGLEKTGSRQGEVKLAGGDLMKKARESPELVTPGDFRLDPLSTFKGKGPAGDDPGAIVNLVGPGKAYEDWKESPEYREWLQRTGQLKAGS